MDFYLSKYLLVLFDELCKRLEICICHNHGVGVHPTPLFHPAHPTRGAGMGFYVSKFLFGLSYELCKKLEVSICYNHGVGVHPHPFSTLHTPPKGRVWVFIFQDIILINMRYFAKN